MISRWCRAICHLYPMCTLGVLGQTRDSTSDIFIERKSAYVYFMSSSVIDMLYTGLIIHHRLYIISFEKFVCLFLACCIEFIRSLFHFCMLSSWNGKYISNKLDLSLRVSVSNTKMSVLIRTVNGLPLQDYLKLVMFVF